MYTILERAKAFLEGARTFDCTGPKAGRARLVVCLLGLLLAMAVPALAQQHQVSGTVTDAEAGTSLPGVNVVVQGTTIGTATDADGRYRLEATSAQDTLVFSFVGYEQQEVAIAGRSMVDVALLPGEISLDEVVVVGYGTKTRQQLASAVTQVSAEELEGVTTANVATMLQGKVSGVVVTNNTGQPGEAPEVLIRGTGSITAGSSPLYVVDGVIADASMAQSIPANSISSVTVLKDAAATALYGSRAANGVIVIDTKSGQAGATQVNVSSSVGFNERIFGNYDPMNSRQLYEFYQAMGLDKSLSWVSEDLLTRDTDWVDLAFRRGLASTTNLSVSGGNERTTFFVSGGYYTEQGTVIASGYDRISARVNLEHAVNDRFGITAHVFGRYETRKFNPVRVGAFGSRGILSQAYQNLPWDVPNNEQGEPVVARRVDWHGRNQVNFLYPMQYNWANGRNQDVGGSLKLEYDLTRWLSFSTTNRATFENEHREEYYDSRTIAGSTYEGELLTSEAYSNSILTSNLLRARQDFGAHSLSGLVGFEYQQNYHSDLSGLGVGIFPGLGILDVTAEAFSLGGEKNKSIFVSGFAQVDYDYKDTYFLTASFRRDGSSRFGADNRFGNFYSIAGAWMMNNEAFLEDVSAIDQLKLRASYGTTGSASIGNFLWWSLYNYSANYSGQAASQPVRLANPNLTWEVARTFNIGADVGLFDRVDLSIDIYQRINTDLLQNVELPKTSGFDFRTLNIGSVRNRGVELAISTVNLTGPLTWSTDFNFGLNRNEVISLYGDRPVFSGGRHRIVEGRDIHAWYTREWAGVDPANGNPLWEKVIYGEDGHVTGVELTSNYNEATLRYVGSATPDFTGGMRNTLQYKGLSLSVFFNFVYGNDVLCGCQGHDGAYFVSNSRALLPWEDRWSEPGDQATHPKPVAGGNRLSNKPSSRDLEDGSYLQVRNVTLSYSLPRSLLQHLNLRALQVYVSGDNLLTLTRRYPGRNPEANVDGEIAEYPQNRTVLFGIRLGL